MDRPPVPSRFGRRVDVDAGETSLTLLESVRRREADGWRRLLDLYSPLLRYWIRGWGVRSEDVDDVAQDVFQAVAVGLAGFRRDRRGDSFRGWLHGVARHKALSHLRRRGPRGVGGTDFLENVPLPPVPDEEERALIGELYRDALETARGEFEERTWRAFWRAAVEGVAPAAVADEMGVSPAAVRQSKSRVLRRLKDLLGEPPRRVDPGPAA